MVKLKLEDLGEILTPEDISNYLGICYNVALKLVKYNIKHLKIGSKYIIQKSDFIDFMSYDTSKQVDLK